jgi:hypothetical protein
MNQCFHAYCETQHLEPQVTIQLYRRWYDAQECNRGTVETGQHFPAAPSSVQPPTLQGEEARPIKPKEATGQKKNKETTGQRRRSQKKTKRRPARSSNNQGHTPSKVHMPQPNHGPMFHSSKQCSTCKCYHRQTPCAIQQKHIKGPIPT